MAQVNIGLEPDDAQTIATRLEALLADEFVLATMARNFHWNVESTSFAELHRFFEAQYDQFDAAIDAVAERIRALGGNPAATLESYLALTRITEPSGVREQAAMMQMLLDGCESVVRSIREDVETCREANDAGTEAFLTDLLVKTEKQAWMVRSFLPPYTGTRNGRTANGRVGSSKGGRRHG